MPRGTVRLLAAAACVLAVTSCGKTVYVDSSNGVAVPAGDAGWQAVEPISVDLPTDAPVRADELQPGLPVRPGTPVLVNIWASYCEPCKEELPLLQRISTSSAVQIIGVTRDRDRGRAAKALSAAKVTYSNWMDPDANVALALDGRVPINLIPSSFLIRDGKVVAVHIGPFSSRADVLAGLEIR